jgi:hypothetical protein
MPPAPKNASDVKKFSTARAIPERIQALPFRSIVEIP